MGATLRGRDATRPVPSGSYQLVRIGDISQDGNFVNKNFVQIDPRQPVSHEQFLRRGDVLFPNRGMRTTAAAYAFELPGAIAGAQFFVLRAKAGTVLPEYLAWFLRTGQSARHFAERRKGSHVQTIEKKDLAELEVPIPPIEVQRRIVAVAELAVRERDSTKRLAVLKWKLVNEQLAQTAAASAAS